MVRGLSAPSSNIPISEIKYNPVPLNVGPGAETQKNINMVFVGETNHTQFIQSSKFDNLPFEKYQTLKTYRVAQK